MEYDSRPAEAIVQVAEEERADIVVVGNVSMSDRTEFLVGSVPNRVSHTAPCTVVIVNTSDGDGRAAGARHRADDGEFEPTEGQLLGRAARIAAVLAKYSRIGSVRAVRSPPTMFARGGSGKRSRSLGRPSQSSARSSRPGRTSSRPRSCVSCPRSRTR
jgi:ubiquinone biosynthesis protein